MLKTSCVQTRLFYGALISFAVGIGVETVWELPMAAVLWWMVVGFGLAVVWRRKGGAFSAPTILLASVCVLAFSLGLLRMHIASWQFGNSSLAAAVGTETSLQGVIITEPDYRERTVQFHLKTDTDKVLVSTDRLTDIKYGDSVVITGKLEQPESFTTGLGRTFNYPDYLKARGIEYRISFAGVTVAGSGQGNPIVTTLLTAKQLFVDILEQIIPEPAIGLGNGLLLGIQSSLGDDIEDDFRRTGIIHIVVLSGYNVMLVVAFILFCFSFFMSLRWRLISGVLAVGAFALVVGLSATVVRASVMASLVLLAQFLGRSYNVLRALLFAGAVMLLLNPYLLVYDIGFQLSFMATLGLVLLLPHFESTVIEKGKSLGWREFVLSTIATQIAVLPLLMYHIGQVSLIAIVVNVLVLPIVPAAMLLTFLAGLMGLVSIPLAGLVSYLATFTLNYILVVARWFADVPYAAVSIPAFSAGKVLLMYACMAMVWWWIWRRKHQANDSTLRGWVIEEEGAGRRPAPETEKIPVFFR